jgi:hypothetical protein
MKDGTPTILYTKETREYARHVRYWRDLRGSQVSLFSCLSRINHVTRVCAMSGERQGQRPFAHVKRVTRQVIRYDSAPAKHFFHHDSSADRPPSDSPLSGLAGNPGNFDDLKFSRLTSEII